MTGWIVLVVLFVVLAAVYWNLRSRRLRSR
jgi:uncharacterized membrane protein YwzB